MKQGVAMSTTNAVRKCVSGPPRGNCLFFNLVTFAFILVLFVGAGKAQSDTLGGITVTVTKTADTNDGACNADCSLREAINTFGSDTIVFSSLFDTPQTITLTLGELPINKNLGIIGKGARLLTVQRSTAMGTAEFRVFNVSGSGVNVTLSGLTVSNGRDLVGGGIRNGNGAILRLNSVSVKNNSASTGAGIYNTGATLNIINSTISHNTGSTGITSGGGINNNADAILDIANSTISNNIAHDGGGILNFSRLRLNNVTITNNAASDSGGGLSINLTAADVKLRNTIIAGNSAPSAPDILHQIGQLSSLGNNLIGNNFSADASFPAGNPNSIGDRVGTPTAPIDAQLGPLQNNGGQTDTHAPFAGYGVVSPAVNTGNNCVTNLSCPTDNPHAALNADQRGTGFLRQRGSAVDLGAFELELISVLNTDDSGVNSLRAALAGSQAGAVILFNFQNGTINLTTGELTISKTLTIAGRGARNTIIQRSTAAGTPNFRIFNVSGAGNIVNISGLTVANGNSGPGVSGGGIINSQSTLTLTGVAVRNNTSGSSGGGIFTAGSASNRGSFNLVNSTVSVNTSVGEAGGLYNYLNCTGSVINSTISGNISQVPGAGIVNAGDLSVINSTITNNMAAFSAGGVRNIFTIRLRNTIIAYNFTSTGDPHVDVTGNFNSDGNNLIGISDGATGFTNGANGDVIGTSASPLNPRLGALSNNGGPTDTHSPLSTSLALNRGNNCVTNLSCPSNNPPVPLTTDQRGSGFPRIFGSFIDIGAFEAQVNLRRAPFDFDGDNRTDISIFRPGSAEWWVNRSLNGSVFATQFGASTDRLAPGDYTGDGKTDIAVWRPSSGEWFVLRSDDFSFFAFPFGLSGDIPAPADFDGDGKADATVFRPSVGTWFIRRSSDGGTTTVAFGANGDVPVPADYDGDGRADMAIYRTSLGQWWLNRSAAGVLATTFGGSTDKPVQGDYTGDGKADVAFFRPSTGDWFILRSENFSFFSFPFGAAGDVPAPGDYDGDGRYDATVFRGSTATWIAQRTTAGTLFQQFGATGDRPIPNSFVP